MQWILPLTPATRKFLSFAKPYKGMIGVATFCGLLKYNIPVIFPWLLKDIIDHLLTAQPPSLAKINGDILLLLFAFTIWTLVTFYRSYLADQAGQRLVFDLRHELYTHLQRMSLSFYEKRQVGSIASRLLSDIALAQNFIGAAFTNTLMDLSSLLLITVLLFFMNWELALVSLSIFPLYIWLNKLFKGRIRTTSQLAQQTMEEISGDLHEKLSGIHMIQAYTREKAEEQQFFRKGRTYLNYRIANIKDNALASAIIGFLTSIAPVIVIWYGAMQVLNGHLTVGELAAFYAYLGMYYQPLNRLTDLNILVANSQSAIERIYEFFTTTPEILDKPNARSVTLVRRAIEFENVSFAYDQTQNILKNINLSVPAGKMVALVGPSGAGKSTFVKLLLRFYDVGGGAIRMDRVDIREIQLRTLRRQIAFVAQEPILFSGSIYENILIGRPDASIEEVESACKAANIIQFINSLSNGLQTEVGESGTKFSGGQKQRLALARAFLKNAPILVLDEPTSALDSESDQLIQDALHKLVQGRTTFIIAHRLSTIKSADIIFVFDQGSIVERGTHVELLSRQGGLYSRLYKSLYSEGRLV